MTVTRDTSADARRVQVEALRRRDGPTRLRMLLRLMLGRELANAVLGRIPALGLEDAWARAHEMTE